ncbi:MAG: ATP-dependent DNA ligase [Promethearchaeota archaeon]
MLFKKFCHYLIKIEKTSGRLEMQKIFQSIFKENMKEGNDFIHDKIVYFCQGKLYPSWVPKPELNMAKKLAIKAISQAIGTHPKQINNLVHKTGDLGSAVAYIMKKSKQTSLLGHREPLLVSTVYNTLVQIANYTGNDSQMRKIRTLASLISRCDPIEAKYILRFIYSKMRLGIADISMIDAISKLLAPDEEKQAEYRRIIERAYNIYPDLGFVLKTAFIHGVEKLKNMQPTIGIPIRSMLAQRLESSINFMEKLGDSFAVEYKLDGERIQIHKKDDDITFFSRRQEIITAQFPEAVNYVKKYVVPNEIILDGEIIAVDPQSGKIMPFQVLMRRKRKHDIDKKVKEVPTQVHVFDVMLCDGRSTLDMPYLERRKIVENSIRDIDKQSLITPVRQKIVNSYKELVDFFNEAINAGTEGLIAKSIAKESVYKPGARGWLWIKLKSLEQGKLPDTIDLVIIGANWGEGRRSGQYGTLLMAALNDKTGNFEMITKTASGMSDELAEYFFKNLEKIADKPKNVRSKEKPDVWVKPKIVIEITGDEITESQLSVTGFSIRFPRILRIREDKSPKDITTVSEILAMRN